MRCVLSDRSRHRSRMPEQHPPPTATVGRQRRRSALPPSSGCRWKPPAAVPCRATGDAVNRKVHGLNRLPEPARHAAVDDRSNTDPACSSPIRGWAPGQHRRCRPESIRTRDQRRRSRCSPVRHPGSVRSIGPVRTVAAGFVLCDPGSTTYSKSASPTEQFTNPRAPSRSTGGLAADGDYLADASS
jgi:hypothetical protein